jgi:hypothetical protein
MNVAGLLGLVCKPVYADGGQVRAVERHGDNEITVFTSPTPMRAGWADISIAVQDSATGEVRNDVEVIVELMHRDAPIVVRATASTQAATNKLLKAAFVELPEQGKWDVTVYVLNRGDGSQLTEIHFAMDVAAAWPEWMTEWPWFCWPVVPILLFIVHRILVAARSSAFHESSVSRSPTAMLGGQ